MPLSCPISQAFGLPQQSRRQLSIRRLKFCAEIIFQIVCNYTGGNGVHRLRSSEPADPSCCRSGWRSQLGHDACAAVGNDPPQFDLPRVADSVENMLLAVHSPFSLAEINVPGGPPQGAKSSAGTTRLRWLSKNSPAHTFVISPSGG